MSRDVGADQLATAPKRAPGAGGAGGGPWGRGGSFCGPRGAGPPAAPAMPAKAGEAASFELADLAAGVDDAGTPVQAGCCFGSMSQGADVATGWPMVLRVL